MCVGGRGTRGGVYRIWYAGETDSASPNAASSRLTNRSQLPRTLRNRCTSWSRARGYRPRSLIGPDTLLAMHATRGDLGTATVRAMEVLTETLRRPRRDDAGSRATGSRARPCAAAAWSLGRLARLVDRRLAYSLQPRHSGTSSRLLTDPDPRVIRTALEAAAARGHEPECTELRPQLLQHLASADRQLRSAAAQVIARWPRNAQVARRRPWTTCPCESGRALPLRRRTRGRVDATIVAEAPAGLSETTDATEKRDACDSPNKLSETSARQAHSHPSGDGYANTQISDRSGRVGRARCCGSSLWASLIWIGSSQPDRHAIGGQPALAGRAREAADRGLRLRSMISTT